MYKGHQHMFAKNYSNETLLEHKSTDNLYMLVVPTRHPSTHSWMLESMVSNVTSVKDTLIHNITDHDRVLTDISTTKMYSNIGVDVLPRLRSYENLDKRYKVCNLML